MATALVGRANGIEQAQGPRGASVLVNGWGLPWLVFDCQCFTTAISRERFLLRLGYFGKIGPIWLHNSARERPQS